MFSGVVIVVATSEMIETMAGSNIGRTMPICLTREVTSCTIPFENVFTLSPDASHVTRSEIKVMRLDVMRGRHWKTVCINDVIACVITGSSEGIRATRPLRASLRKLKIPVSSSGSTGPNASSRLITIALASSTN